jgi:hypothetical protein
MPEIKPPLFGFRVYSQSGNIGVWSHERWGLLGAALPVLSPMM